jgi:hypothetical protein
VTTEPQQQEFTCVVCGTPVPAAMSAECNWCDGRYHLNQRNDVEEKDCGAVWIDEQYLALQFACQNCLSGPAADSRGTPTPKPERMRVRLPGQRSRRYKRRA